MVSAKGVVQHRLIGRFFGMAFVTLALMSKAGCFSRKHGGTALFLGDSITEAGYFIDDIAQSWRTHPGEAPDRVVYLGVGGETVSGLTELLFPGVRSVVFSGLDRELKRYRPCGWGQLWYE